VNPEVCKYVETDIVPAKRREQERDVSERLLAALKAHPCARRIEGRIDPEEPSKFLD